MFVDCRDAARSVRQYKISTRTVIAKPTPPPAPRIRIAVAALSTFPIHSHHIKPNVAADLVAELGALIAAKRDHAEL